MQSPAWKRRFRNLVALWCAILRGEPAGVLLPAARGHVRPMPEQAKRLTLRHYARCHGLRVFVETGTFRGETISFLEPEMDEIHSIELSDTLFRAARQKFDGNPKVHLYKGDSADILPGILTELGGPALLWLDAHYSAKITAHGPEETPILAEMHAVFSVPQRGHVILIDDAREFEDNPAYPALERVRAMALQNGYAFECRFDLIRLLPAGA